MRKARELHTMADEAAADVAVEMAEMNGRLMGMLPRPVRAATPDNE